MLLNCLGLLPRILFVIMDHTNVALDIIMFTKTNKQSYATYIHGSFDLLFLAPNETMVTRNERKKDMSAMIIYRSWVLCNGD